MNILLFCQFSEGYNTEFRNRISAIVPDADLYYYNDNSWSEEEFHQIVEKAEVIIGYFNPEILKYCKNLKLILFDIAGMDRYINHPDMPEGTIVCNSSGAYGVVLAEHAVGLAMAVCRDIHTYTANKAERKWKIRYPDKVLEGSTVLILGAGDIGCNTARLMRQMVGKIIGVRRVPRGIPENFDEMISLDEIDEYLPQADYVICALPSTKATIGLLNIDRLRLMKDDCVLVNVGRGSLIPVDDLVQALNEGKFRGVGLDVVETEPLPQDSPLWDIDRVIITPHAAGNAISQDSPTNKRIFDIIYSNLEKYVKGQPLDHVVDRATGYRVTAE